MKKVLYFGLLLTGIYAHPSASRPMTVGQKKAILDAAKAGDVNSLQKFAQEHKAAGRHEAASLATQHASRLQTERDETTRTQRSAAKRNNLAQALEDVERLRAELDQTETQIIELIEAQNSAKSALVPLGAGGGAEASQKQHHALGHLGKKHKETKRKRK